MLTYADESQLEASNIPKYKLHSLIQKADSKILSKICLVQHIQTDLFFLLCILLDWCKFDCPSA